MINNRISRVLQVLSLVAFNPEPTRLKEIGDKLGLHPSMVSRIVADLIAGGLLVKSAYRSVIATPALAVLGKSAGKNHPLSRIAREVLQQPVSEMGLSCEFATVAPGGLFHFYQVRRGTPPAEPLWRSDAAAVIFAARGDEWEEVLEELRFAASGEQESEFPRFKERFLEARESLNLINYHAGSMAFTASRSPARSRSRRRYSSSATPMAARPRPAQPQIYHQLSVREKVPQRA